MEVSLWGMTHLFLIIKFFSFSCQGCLLFMVSWGFHFFPFFFFFLQVSGKLYHLPKHSPPVSLLRRVPFLVSPLAGLVPGSGPGLGGWGSLRTPSPSLPLVACRARACREDTVWGPGALRMRIWSRPRAVRFWISGLCQQSHIVSVKSRRVEYFPILFLYSVIRRIISTLPCPNVIE